MQIDLEKLQNDVEAVFTAEKSYDWQDVQVEAREYGDEVHIEVSKMYEHLPLTFDTLMKLSELFGTRDYSVNQWSHGGCETCDYGSKYAHEFTVKSSALKAAQASQSTDK